MWNSEMHGACNCAIISKGDKKPSAFNMTQSSRQIALSAAFTFEIY